MPREVTLLSVFVASPTDVTEEREAVAEVINEINTTWGKRLKLMLELIRWKTHTFPAAGDDPQAIINRQIGEDYDIFIGILARRFGTPTERAGSGTEEEFNRAHARQKEAPDSVQIMVYFNVAPFYPKSKEELEQFAAVLNFKDSLGEKGVLYDEFPSAADFPSVVRAHLPRVLQEFLDRRERTPIPQAGSGGDRAAPAVVEPEPTAGDDAGLYDLIEEAELELRKNVAAINAINDAQNEMTAVIAECATEVRVNPEVEAGPDYKRVKKAIDRAAEAMKKYARRAVELAPVLATTYRASATNITRAVALAVDFGPKGRDEIATLVQTFAPMRENITSAIAVNGSLRSTVKGLPRASTAFNQAKRQVIDAITTLEREFLVIIELTQSIERTIRETLDNWPSEK